MSKKISKKATQTPQSLVTSAVPVPVPATTPTEPMYLEGGNVCGRMLELNVAAEALLRHLGESLGHWIDFLREDAAVSNSRQSSPDDLDDYEEPYMSWHNLDRIPYCDADDVYRYIAQRNPKSIGLNTGNGEAGLSPHDIEFSVRPVVDHEHGGQLLVRVSPPEGRIDTSELTIREARRFAHDLLWAADYCENHVYDYFLGVFKKENPLATPSVADDSRARHAVKDRHDANMHNQP